MNDVDYGSVYSNNLTIQADQLPTRMNTPATVSVTPTAIKISWSEITSDDDIGRDDIIFYQVEWD
jgi:hypothetical protein